MNSPLAVEAAKMFDAKVVESIHGAADQDGHDGGWIGWDGEREVWGKTPEQAQFRLKMAQMMDRQEN